MYCAFGASDEVRSVMMVVEEAAGAGSDIVGCGKLEVLRFSMRTIQHRETRKCISSLHKGMELTC